MTSIEWTEQTWNPTVGCSKVSEGCRNCYAIGQAYRNNAMGQKLDNPGRLAYYDGLTEKRSGRTEWTGAVNFVPEALSIPLKRKKPTVWFVNSMSDLFHDDVTDEQLDQIFAIMALTPYHTYQVLTKRPKRMLEYLSDRRRSAAIVNAAMRKHGVAGLPVGWFPAKNIWLGVSAENQKAADDRIPLLLQTPAATRFLSCEPLLEEVEIYRWLDKGFGAPVPRGQRSPSIDWVIVGGESGHGSRPCEIDWIRSVVLQCCDAEIPCFVKQLGEQIWYKDQHGTLCRLPVTGKGSNTEEWPEDLRVRKYPEVVAK
jgi:protein gp37